MAKTIADRHIFGNELCEIGKTRKDFVVLNADTKACNLEKFQEQFPDRAFTIGIAEQDMVATAAGMATCGDKVFLSTFAVFATMRACEQVRTFVCHTNANVTILGTHTGLQVGGDGATHAAVEDIGITRTFPNLTIIQPSDGVSAKALAHARPWPTRQWISRDRCMCACTGTQCRISTIRRPSSLSSARPSP